MLPAYSWQLQTLQVGADMMNHAYQYLVKRWFRQVVDEVFGPSEKLV